MVANGKLNSQFINVESEHSAASVVLGSVAAGVRSFTATSSQGLLLMAEVVFNIAGMRLPVVMTCANRAISAPLNIWNDHQDAITVRDSGWVQMHAENIQEALDLHIQAYRIAEGPKIMLPVMVNMDGFILTHGLEVVDVPDQEQVDRFLPAYKPLFKLDVENPLTLGPLVDPDYYMETRFAMHETHKDVLKLIPLIKDEFQKVFNRPTGGLVEGYRIDDAEKGDCGYGLGLRHDQGCGGQPALQGQEGRFIKDCYLSSVSCRGYLSGLKKCSTGGSAGEGDFYRLLQPGIKRDPLGI